MSNRIFPTPLANIPRSTPDDPYEIGNQAIHTNSGTVYERTIHREYGVREKYYKLPSGGSIEIRSYIDASTQHFEMEQIYIKGADGKSYFAYHKDGTTTFMIRESGGGRKPYSEVEFIDATISIIGPYDPEYTRALQQYFQEQRNVGNPIVSDASHGQHVRLHITTDGHGAVIEERQAGAPPKTTHAFLNGDRLVIPNGLRDFNQAQKTEQWKGNEWSPELQAKLGSAMPKEDITALKNAMKSGKITLEVDEVRGTPVCQALAGKASPACKKSGAER